MTLTIHETYQAHQNHEKLKVHKNHKINKGNKNYHACAEEPWKQPWEKKTMTTKKIS